MALLALACFVGQTLGTPEEIGTRDETIGRYPRSALKIRELQSQKCQTSTYKDKSTGLCMPCHLSCLSCDVD